jgi:hypothetical protein
MEIIDYEDCYGIIEQMLRAFDRDPTTIINRVQRFGFDPRTLAPISVDGIAGPKTRDALYYNPKLMLETPNLKVALQEILSGSQEIGGSNMGPFVRKYFRLKKDPAKNAGPFCAGGASYCLDQGFPEDDTPYIVGAQRLGKAVSDQGIFKGKSLKERRFGADKMKPGDLMIYERITDTPGTGHVGTVVHNSIDRVITVDFNVGRYPAPTRLFIQTGKENYAQGGDKFLFGARWK